MVVKNWIQSRKKGIRGGRLLVRVLNMIEIRWGCRILAGWWRTYHNVDTDYITHCSDQEFVEFVKAKGFHVIDVKMAVQEALVDSESFGPCFLYGTDQEDRSALLQFKERRLKRQVQKSLPIRWDRVRVVEWSCHGRSVKDFEATAGHLGAHLEETHDTGRKVILCATLGVDSQGRQLCKVLNTAKTAGATLCIIEGTSLVHAKWAVCLVVFLDTIFGVVPGHPFWCPLNVLSWWPSSVTMALKLFLSLAMRPGWVNATIAMVIWCVCHHGAWRGSCKKEEMLADSLRRCITI